MEQRNTIEEETRANLIVLARLFVTSYSNCLIKDGSCTSPTTLPLKPKLTGKEEKTCSIKKKKIIETMEERGKNYCNYYH